MSRPLQESPKALSRRAFLKMTGLSATGLVLGSMLPVSLPAWAHTSENHSKDLNLFVSIEHNGQVNIICHRSEMGQGIRTSIPQIVADELCVNWEDVNVVQGLANEAYGSQNTDGSRSIRNFYTKMREMGAMARTMLEQAAADQWQVPLDEVFAKDSFVVHKASGKRISFGSLADAAAKVTAPAVDSLTYKSKKDFKYIGKPMQIIDLPDIVTGNTVFGQDIKLEGMLYASIERNPVVGSKVEGFDKTAATKVKGVVDVYQMPTQPSPVLFNPMNGVAVIANNTWAALQGRKALNITWGASEHSSHNSEQYLTELNKRIVNKGKSIRARGDAYQAIEKAAKTHSATYTMPYLVHAPMEPPAATAVFKDGHCEIWACTQTPQSTQQNVAGALGIEKDKVKINVTLLGGAFGRKSKPDFSIEAALLAKHTGKPVKVVWSREDDIKQGYYHAISSQHFIAGMNDKNQVESWVQRTAFPSISWTFNGSADEPSDGELSLGFGDVPFAVSNLSCETHKAPAHLRIGWVRSVSNIQHAFAQGSFVDELAVAANIPAHDMWQQLLGEDRKVDPTKEGFKYGNYGEPLDNFPIDTKRLKHVLNDVVSKSGANKATAEGEAWGISAHRSFVSYVAVATKVRVKNGKVEVLEMHSSIDAGTIVNPDRVRSQQEGSMIFGLSLALMGEITVKDGAVQQSNYSDYQVLRMPQSPKIVSYIVESDEIPGGVGEPGTPPVAASLANAIYRASGKRIRDLPVNKHFTV
ncbi:xanthine dehydrogenase family protein molybdopterin-binding subunit [Glaciecola sp. MH2013]|uniref:xanthine dehydrogenase family protein molybdopterin-binding subunit n=1 Tax=Glaciecola sp. MH2013 TaxID=2785524 RepID=UPI00189FF4DF|nr:molybdopterin cofactor-binding domain-containing protein [Glaciecola sp. MH2013]MBF7074248.1 xanthine dehydrogenase family protein molybdopterin-binding subunit [Glaciecola sp. MH2013]